MRAARALTAKVPNPASVTVPSCFKVAVTESITASSARLADAYEMSDAYAISSISSVLFTDSPWEVLLNLFRLPVCCENKPTRVLQKIPQQLLD